MAKAKEIKVTLRKSVIGQTERQKACVKGLGLRRVHSTKILKDTPEVRGMIKKVEHLVNFEEVK